MPIGDVHQAHQHGATPAEVTADDAESALYVAIWAHSSGDETTAHRAAAQAHAADPGSELARLLVTITTRSGGTEVYDSPAAFRAFIRGGGNTALYAETSAALAGIYRQHRPRRVLDIGAGDGLALLPALADHQTTVGTAPTATSSALWWRPAYLVEATPGQ